MLSVAIFTGARSEYGIFRSLMRLLQSNNTIQFQLIVSGMHLSPEFGNTINLIKEDGFTPTITIENLLSSDSKVGTIKSIALELLGLSDKLTILRPDIMFVLGDRFETFAASLAALHLNITLAHIHGGDKAQAVFDDYYRNSITLYSNLHFVATLDSMKNVLMLGVSPEFVFLTGSPTQDEIVNTNPIARSILASRFNLNKEKNWILAVYHPVAELENTIFEFNSMIESLESVKKELNLQIILVYPNADSGGRTLIKIITEMKKDNDWLFIKNFKREEYISLLREIKFLIGNSSSGIIEAPILSLPVINIGFRQNNRLRGNNVFDVEGDTKKIKELIKKLFTDINMIKNLKEHPYSPYGDGNAAKRIMNIILSLTNVEKLKSNNFQNNSLLIEKLSQIEQINYSDFPDRGITPQELLKLYLPKEKKKI